MLRTGKTRVQVQGLGVRDVVAPGPDPGDGFDPCRNVRHKTDDKVEGITVMTQEKICYYYYYYSPIWIITKSVTSVVVAKCASCCRRFRCSVTSRFDVSKTALQMYVKLAGKIISCKQPRHSSVLLLWDIYLCCLVTR